VPSRRAFLVAGRQEKQTAILIEATGNAGVSASPPPFSATTLLGMFVFNREHNGQNSRKKMNDCRRTLSFF
jgi:hypothetical protein